ncbi:MAG: hypothetical protein RL186_1383 [Pseudomonadota bacterium]
MADPQLSARTLCLQRGHRRLLTDFSIRIDGGEGLCLRGPNGSGKTTLLRALAGLHQPASGKVQGHVDGEGVSRVSFLGHQDPIKAGAPLRDQLRFWQALSGQSAPDIEAIAERLGLTRQLDLAGGALSAGQRRRASLARLMLEARPIWLLDEPAAPLDGMGRALLGHILDQHRSQGGLFVAAVHDDLPGAAVPTFVLEGA